MNASQSNGIAAKSNAARCAYVIVFAMTSHVTSSRAEDAWSLKCSNVTSAPSKPSECSLAQSVVSTSNPAVWLKLGVTYSDHSMEPKLAIITPKIDYLRDGVSIMADGNQLGSVPIEYCDRDKSCAASVNLDGQLLSDLEAAKTVSFEYQVGEKNGVRISAPFDSFAAALRRLREKVGITETTLLSDDPKDAGQDKNANLRVEIRYNTLHVNNLPVYGEVIPDCNGSPASINLSVDGFETDNVAFDDWIRSTGSCGRQKAYWVREPPGKFAAAEAVSRIVAELARKVPSANIFVSPAGIDLPMRPQPSMSVPGTHDWATNVAQ